MRSALRQAYCNYSLQWKHVSQHSTAQHSISGTESELELQKVNRQSSKTYYSTTGVRTQPKSETQARKQKSDTSNEWGAAALKATDVSSTWHKRVHRPCACNINVSVSGALPSGNADRCEILGPVRQSIDISSSDVAGPSYTRGDRLKKLHQATACACQHEHTTAYSRFNQHQHCTVTARLPVKYRSTTEKSTQLGCEWSFSK